MENRELSRGDLERLVAAGLIGEDRAREMLDRFRHSVDWRRWSVSWATAFGYVFLLAGILFFFAWNWQELSPVIRFSILQGGLILTVAGSIYAGLETRNGKWLLTGAGFLTGVLVAVYGQVYQTGADACEVFALWMFLLLPWVLTARFLPLWVLWFAVLQTTWMTWAGQILIPGGEMTWIGAYFGAGLICAGLLVLWEWVAVSEPFSWLRGEWIRLTLLIPAVFWLTAIPLEGIVGFRWTATESGWAVLAGSAVWLAATGYGVYYYVRVQPSLASLGICVLSVAGILVVFLVDRIIASRWEEGWALLAGAGVAIAVFSGAAWAIVRAAKGISGVKEGRPGS